MSSLGIARDKDENLYLYGSMSYRDGDESCLSLDIEAGGLFPLLECYAIINPDASIEVAWED